MRERGPRYHDTIPPCRDTEHVGNRCGTRAPGSGPGEGREQGREERRETGRRITQRIPGRPGSLMPGNGQGGWSERPERPHVPGAAANPRPRGRGHSSPQQGPVAVPPLPDLGSPLSGPHLFPLLSHPGPRCRPMPPAVPGPAATRGRPSPPCPPWPGRRAPLAASCRAPRPPLPHSRSPRRAAARPDGKRPLPLSPALAPRPRRGQSTARPGPVTPIPPWVLGTGPGTGPVTDPRYRPPVRPLPPLEKRFCCPVSQALFPSPPAPWRRPPASRPKMAHT